MQKTQSRIPLKGTGLEAAGAPATRRKLIKVLLISADRQLSYEIRRAMAEAGSGSFSLEHTDRMADGLERLSRGLTDVLLYDPRVPDNRELTDSLVWKRARDAGIAVVLLGEEPAAAGEIEALKKGAQEYLPGDKAGELTVGAIYRAVTRQKQITGAEPPEKRPETGEAVLQNIVTSNPDGLIIVDDKGIVRFINPAVETIFGCNADQLLGEPLDFMSTVENGRTELSIIRSDGEQGIIEMRVVKTKYRGAPAYLASIRDITRSKKEEETSARNHSELEASVRKATKEAEKAREETERIKSAARDMASQAREEAEKVKTAAQQVRKNAEEASAREVEDARRAMAEAAKIKAAAQDMKAAAQEKSARAQESVRLAKEEVWAVREEANQIKAAAEESVAAAEEQAALMVAEAEQARDTALEEATRMREEAWQIQREAEAARQAAEEAAALAEEDARRSMSETEEFKATARKAREAAAGAKEEIKLARQETEKIKAASEAAVAKSKEEAAMAGAIAAKAREDAEQARATVDEAVARTEEAVARANAEITQTGREAAEIKAAAEEVVAKAKEEVRKAREEAEMTKKAAEAAATRAKAEAEKMKKEAEKMKAAAQEAAAKAKEEIRLARASRQASDEAITKANEELRHLDPMQSEFMSNIIHELRAPIHSIQAFAKLLTEGGVADRETQGEFLNIIDSQGEHLRKLVDELVDISPVKSGRFEIRKASIATGELLRGAVREVAAVARQKDITINEEIPEELPDILADGQRIKQVMFNLLGNAIKFSSEGCSIGVRAETGNGSLLVQVSDQGIGITEETMPLLFQKFYQARDTGRVGGLGLGLYISRRIIEAHGGRIWAESPEGAGSTFSFTLPLE